MCRVERESDERLQLFATQNRVGNNKERDG